MPKKDISQKNRSAGNNSSSAAKSTSASSKLKKSKHNKKQSENTNPAAVQSLSQDSSSATPPEPNPSAAEKVTSSAKTSPAPRRSSNKAGAEVNYIEQPPQDFYAMSPQKVLDTLGSDKTGLGAEEITQRLARYGPNTLTQKKKKSKFATFVAQFKDIMLIILFIAAGVSAAVALIEKNYSDLIDVAIILAIVILNAIIGFIQENKAENALASLKKMSRPYVKVMRGGKLHKIPTEEVVPGDVLLLEAGDVVCADAYLLESGSLRCDESSLTGESAEVDKQAGTKLETNTPIGDRINMVHASSVVTYGRGTAVVTSTAMGTEIGKIAGMLNEEEREVTPIQEKLTQLGKLISIIVLAIAVLIFLVNVVIKDTHDVMQSLMVAIAIAVAAIPESLPAVVTIIMAMGVSRMSKKKAIIRKLHAVETLGSCQVICTDKTGTLTQNKMTVKSVLWDGKIITEKELKTLKDPDFINCLTLCNDCVTEGANIHGDPTETALVAYARDLKFEKTSAEQKHPRVNELPFDSIRKMMTTFNKVGSQVIGYTKGAPDLVIERCEKIKTSKGVIKLSEKDKTQLYAALERMAEKGLRTLALAYKPHKGKDYSFGDEQDMILLGITAMRDPPRPSTKEAVATCRSAGIKPVMITGDHATTAREIAREVGIFEEGDLILTGSQLDAMNEADYDKILEKVSVYARVSPENKVRIVEAWKSHGKVVAMTGDGVNDAPSIKRADIGVGMGISGTEVTKEVADMVLTDDNFATIVGAVQEGRKIYSNIRKVIQFLLGTNMVEVLALVICTIAFPHLTFLLALQILFINLITDSLPALSLSVERSEPDIMKCPPRDKKESIFSGGVWQSMLTQILYQTLIVVGVFALAYKFTSSNILATTMAFATISITQLFHICNVRTTHSLFRENPFHNGLFWATLGLGILFNILVITVPPIANVFGFTQLSITQWAIIFGISATIIPVMEIYKLIVHAMQKRKRKTPSRA